MEFTAKPQLGSTATAALASNEQINHSYSNHIELNGVLILDKPADITSNQALQKIKHLFRVKKAGHTGSLDPKATGMLAICLGEATKFSQFLLEADKRYRVVGQLGEITPSGDAETPVVERHPIDQITTRQIAAALEQFRGTIWQLPPMHSAIKMQGRPLYKLAHQGVEVERTPRQITIYALELLTYDPTSGQVTLDLHCSKGTYVRTIITDLGAALGCGAHTAQLRRLAVGPYSAEQMVGLEQLAALAAQQRWEELRQLILPIDSMLTVLPAVTVTPATQYYLRQGNSVLVPQAPAQGLVKLVNRREELFGVGQVLADGKIAPCKLVKNHNN